MLTQGWDQLRPRVGWLSVELRRSSSHRKRNGIIYNHEDKCSDEAITETSQHHRQSILSSLHAHIDDAHCLCALLVRGKVPDIASLEGELKREKGIMQVKSSYLETESI